MPLVLQEFSSIKFGKLKFDIVCEQFFEGDSLTIQHGIEVTSKKCVGLLNGDLVYIHTMCGMHTDFRHGHFKCLFCEIEKQQLSTPWHMFPTKPQLRSKESISRNLAKYKSTASPTESKGVINMPILDFPM